MGVRLSGFTGVVLTGLGLGSPVAGMGETGAPIGALDIRPSVMATSMGVLLMGAVVGASALGAEKGALVTGVLVGTVFLGDLVGALTGAAVG